MIGYTLAEIRRLLVKISQYQPPSPDHAWSCTSLRDLSKTDENRRHPVRSSDGMPSASSQVGHMQAQHRPTGRLTLFNVGNRLAQTSSLLTGIGAKSAYDSLCYGRGAD
jgi:hypothetical protein